jgi:hypothetical protein
MEENVKNLGIIHVKLRNIFFISTIMVLLFILAIIWPNDFENEQAIIYTLSPHPHNQQLQYESSLCSSKNIPIKPPPHNNIRCPQKPILTVKQLGRLGNQMHE